MNDERIHYIQAWQWQFLSILYMSNFHHKSTPDEVTPKNTHRLVKVEAVSVFNLQSWNPTWQWMSLQREYEVWDIFHGIFVVGLDCESWLYPNGTWRQMHFNTFIHTLVCWIIRSTTTILPLEVNLHQGSPIVDGKSFVPKIGNHFSRVSSLCLCICIWYMYIYICECICIQTRLTCLINWFFPFLPSTNITPTANTPCRGFTKTHTVTVLKLSPSLGTKGGAMEESPSTVVSPN